MAPSIPNPWAEPLPLPLEQMTTFLVLMPDLADSKRLSLRATHLEQSAVGAQLGWVLNGGPTFSPTDPSKMDGSWQLCRGVSEQAVRERLARDVYAREGAWDISRIQVRKVGHKGV